MLRLMESRDLSLIGYSHPVDGIAMEVDGNVVALGGVHSVLGSSWAVLKLVDAARVSAHCLARSCRAGLRIEGTVYTTCDLTILRAEAWLRWLGFKPTGQTVADWVWSRLESVTDLSKDDAIREIQAVFGLPDDELTREVWSWQSPR